MCILNQFHATIFQPLPSLKRERYQNVLKVIKLHQQQQETIALAIDGNRHAQHLIYNTYAGKMLGVCRQYIKDLHNAEDVMITAFMKVFSNLASFNHQGSFEGWIRRIMVNESISFLRANRKISFMEDESFVEDTANNIESGLSVDDIQNLIDSLPEGYKMIFNLYAIEGYKHKEIAEMLGINEGTSKSQLSHARRVLQEQIEKRKNYEKGIG